MSMKVTSWIVMLVMICVLVGCGDDDDKARGPVELDADAGDAGDEADTSDVEEVSPCEAACGHVFDTCQKLPLSSHRELASKETCLTACEAGELGEDNVGVECLANAQCSNTVFFACIPAATSCEGLAHWPVEFEEFEEEVLEIVNLRRSEGADCGGTIMNPTGPLRMNATLRCAARRHSVDMVERDFFDHENPDGDGPSDRILREGYSAYPLGENIAYGQTTPAEVMVSWINSPGHCRNLMSPDYGEIGVGYTHMQGNMPHVWTQKFGGGRP